MLPASWALIFGPAGDLPDLESPAPIGPNVQPSKTAKAGAAALGVVRAKNNGGPASLVWREEPTLRLNPLLAGTQGIAMTNLKTYSQRPLPKTCQDDQ
jgi:hypothetical protein